jgi:hypothetical protein
MRPAAAIAMKCRAGDRAEVEKFRNASSLYEVNGRPDAGDPGSHHPPAHPQVGADDGCWAMVGTVSVSLGGHSPPKSVNSEHAESAAASLLLSEPPC